MKEIWKDIIGLENRYQVSNYGRVKSLSRMVPSSVSPSGYRRISEKILTPRLDTRGYYYLVQLPCNGKFKNYLVHRVVAEAFCENPENLTQIDHIDGNSRNNTSCNLRFVTHKQNSNNPITKKRMSIAKLGLYGISHNRHKPVAQLNMNGELIKIWDYVKQAAECLNISRSNISSCAKGKLNSAGGYKWTYNFKV